MIYNKRPHWIVPVLQTGFVAGCAYSSTMIWANLQGSPLAAEIAASVGLGAASFSAMVFGVAWNGLTVQVIDSAPHAPKAEQPPAPGGYQPLDNTATTAYRPRMVFLPTGPNSAIALEITAEQLAELRRRVTTGRLNIPVNGLQKFTSSEAKKLRQEAEDKRLVRVIAGNQVEWTLEAAGMILRASPAPLVRV